MHTHNVNTAAQESSRKMGENPSPFVIFVAENETGAEEWDVMEFSSLADLKKMRRRCPEKMKGSYSYALCCGVDKAFHCVTLVEADHFKQFVRQLDQQGFTL